MAIARSEGKAESREEGRSEGFFNALVGLVKKGMLTISQAAEEAHMTEAEFKEKTGFTD